MEFAGGLASNPAAMNQTTVSGKNGGK